MIAAIVPEQMPPREPLVKPVNNREYLHELPSGARAVVQHIDEAHDSMRRLMAMGLCVGREIEVVRQGNPLILRLLGARIGVSGRLARRISVERVS
ncbi:MAG TPA: FeoA family protein [Verrucomicrobiae bacterium]|nr:FeoA family protein [Verrucomicrobiae bacterium]